MQFELKARLQEQTSILNGANAALSAELENWERKEFKTCKATAEAEIDRLNIYIL